MEELSIASLQAELQAIDEGIATALQNVAALEAGERDALARRDKLALDVAWQGREIETAKLQGLDQRRTRVYEALRRRFEPEVDAWRTRCEGAVASWRAEDREQVDRIEASLRVVETLVWSLTNRDKRRAIERKRLIEELEELHAKAGAIPLARPEIDWTTEAISLRDVMVRLESVLELLQRPDVESPLSAE